jgi:hypothetical protein
VRADCACIEGSPRPVSTREAAGSRSMKTKLFLIGLAAVGAAAYWVVRPPAIED